MRSYARILMMVSVLFSLIVPAEASAATPYNGYTWNSLGHDVRSINGYVYVDSIDGMDMGSGPFKNPESIFVGADDSLYLVDTGNNRIVHMDRNHRLIKVIGTEDKGKLSGPKGVFVKEDGTVYVADTKNHRVLSLARMGNS